MVIDRDANDGLPPVDQGIPSAQNEPGAPRTYTEDEAKGMAQRRINDLTREKREAQRQFDEAAGTIGELQSRMKDLEQRVPGGDDDADTARSWDKLPEKKLFDVIENRDQYGDSAVANSIREIKRRAIEEATAAAAANNLKFSKQESHRQNVLATIVKDFGDDAMDNDSQLRMRAEQYYQTLAQTYGKEKVDAMPDMQHYCFQRANQDLRSGDAEELQKLRSYKDQQERLNSVESGPPGAGRASGEIKEALQRGDTRGAINNLGVIQAMREQEDNKRGF